MSAPPLPLGQRAGRGRAPRHALERRGEVEEVAREMLFTWSVLDAGEYSSRLRRTLLAHKDELVRMFASGIRVSQVWEALVDLRVTKDDGLPLTYRAFICCWGRLEQSLLRKERNQGGVR